MILDSSFLISLYLPDDENHRRALEEFEKHRAEDMLITDLILFETMTVLNYEAGIEVTKEAYEQLLSNSRLQLVYLSESERREILDEFFRQERKFSVEDISVIHSCRKTLALPLAFDKKLLKQIR